MTSPSSESGTERRSLACTVPPEIWIMILSELDYSQLKKASRICKTLQGYILGQEFDAILFRQGAPSNPPKERTRLELHPVLRAVDARSEDWESMRITVEHEGQRKTYFPKDYPSILDEFATSPAASPIRLFLDWAHIGTTGPTVGEVLEGIANSLQYLVESEREEYLANADWWPSATATGNGEAQYLCDYD
ncbi:hypothetical protein JCM16303_004648 [Sporobolomyces ruberrimus]